MKPKLRKVIRNDKPEGWVEIMASPVMADWIRDQSLAEWRMRWPGIFWISPKLYTFWKLRWK